MLVVSENLEPPLRVSLRIANQVPRVPDTGQIGGVLAGWHLSGDNAYDVNARVLL